MSADSGQIFAFMQVAYNKGILDKFMPIFGNALKELLQKTGMRMDELLGLMDMAKEETVEKAAKLVRRSGIFLKAASSEHLMGFTSRLLDFRTVSRVVELAITWYLGRAVIKARATAS